MTQSKTFTQILAEKFEAMEPEAAIKAGLYNMALLEKLEQHLAPVAMAVATSIAADNVRTQERHDSEMLSSAQKRQARQDLHGASMRREHEKHMGAMEALNTQNANEALDFEERRNSMSSGKLDMHE